MIFNPKIPYPVLWIDPLITPAGIVMMWMMTYLNARIPERLDKCFANDFWIDMYFDSSILLPSLIRNMSSRSSGNLLCQVALNWIQMALWKKAPDQEVLEVLSETIEVTGSLALISKEAHVNPILARLLMEKLGAAMPTHIFREQNKVSDKKEGL